MNFRLRWAFLLVAIFTVGSITPDSFAQGASGLPDPISSTELNTMLAAAGADESDLALTVDPHGRYLRSMATLRKGEIESWLEEKRERPGVMDSSDPEMIGQRTAERRRLAMRIASLDRSLFNELGDSGIDQEVIDRARSARSRARSRSLAGRRFTSGIRFEPLEIYASIMAGPDVTEDRDQALEAAVLEIIFEHDRLRTSRLAALSNAAIELPFARAEMMAEFSDAQPDPRDTTAEDMTDWLATRERIGQEAAIDARDLQADIVKLDRMVLNRILSTFPDSNGHAFAIAFRNEWLAAAHPSAFPDRESPASLFEKARVAREKGEMPDETYSEIESLEAAWRPSHRALEDRLNEAIEEEIRAGSTGSSLEIGGVSITIGTDGIPFLDTPDRPSTGIRQDRADLDRSIRTRLEMLSPELLANRVREGTVGALRMGGGGDGDGQSIVFSAVMIGDSMGGEAIQINTDGAMFAMKIAGVGSSGIPRPIDRAAFDVLIMKLNVDDATRPIGDVLFLAYQDGWVEIEETLVAAFQETRKPGFGPGGPVSADPADVRRGAAQRLDIFNAMNDLDASLFRDLGTVIDAPEMIKSLMMQRRRAIAVETLQGGRGMFPAPGRNQVADLDLTEALKEVLPTSEWDDQIDQLSREYAEEITPALVSRTLGLIEVERDAQLAEQNMMTAFSEDSGGGGAVVRSMAVDFDAQSDLMRNLQEIDRRRTAIEAGVADRQLSWRARLAAALPSGIEPEFQLAVDRLAWPRCFRDPRSPEPMFKAALDLPNLTESQHAALLELRADWRAAWNGACRELITIEAGGAGAAHSFDGEPDIAAMQKNQSERKRIRFVRSEIDERAARKLLELLTPEQAATVGELPEPAKSNFPIDFGNVEMFISG